VLVSWSRKFQSHALQVTSYAVKRYILRTCVHLLFFSYKNVIPFGSFENHTGCRLYRTLVSFQLYQIATTVVFRHVHFYMKTYMSVFFYLREFQCLLFRFFNQQTYLLVAIAAQTITWLTDNINLEQLESIKDTRKIMLCWRQKIIHPSYTRLSFETLFFLLKRYIFSPLLVTITCIPE